MFGLEIRRRPEPDVWKGLAAGVAAGLVATAVMTTFQNVWKEVSKTMTAEKGEEESGGAGDGSTKKGERKGDATKDPGSRSAAASKGQGKESSKESSSGGDQEGANATEVVASKISEEVFDHELAKKEKEQAGLAVHYGFGTVIGAAYGVAAELLPPVTAGAGAIYGATVWLGADETVLPILGLAKGPTEYPASMHAYGLAAHLVYGVTAEMVRRMVRHVL